MRLLRFLILLLLATGLAGAGTPGADRALALAGPWRLAPGEKPPKSLHVCYFTPSDVAASDDHAARVNRIMHDIQGFYRSEMERHGFGPLTFPLDENPDGTLRLIEVKGARAAAIYSYDSGDAIRRECVAVLKKSGIQADRETILIYSNLYRYDGRSIEQFAPYYGGGDNFSGTAWLCDSPILDANNLTEKEKHVRDKQYGDISVGRYNSIFIGGTAHELGHALGLPHNEERPDEAERGTALMGSGNRTYGEERRQDGKGSFLTFAHALRLLSHPLFGGAKGGKPGQPPCELTEATVTAGATGFTFQGKVTSPVPVYAVVAYTDPAGGDDYDATTATAIPETDGRFVLDCNALRKNRAGELRLVFCHADGNTTHRAWSYAVAQDGRPNIDSIKLPLLLDKAATAVVSGEAGAFAAEAQRLRARPAQDATVLRYLDELEKSLRPEKDLPLPAEAAQDGQKTVALADCRSESRRVGWLAPARNHLPEAPGLLASGGRLWAHGLYAHAPATYAYDLGGQFAKLRGQVGLADGREGSVIFLVRADGRELWRSKLVKPGQVVPFDLAVKDARKLELVTDPGPDGNGSDWGLWLEPTVEKK